MPDRKPLAPMESLVPRSVRLEPTDWQRVEQAARMRGFEMLVFTRKLILYALSIAEEQSRLEASVGVPSEMLTGSRRTRRF